MKKMFLVGLLWLGCLAFGQTGKEIILKNIELSGGLINWKLLNSVTLQGKVTLGVNDEYPITILQQRPNLTKTLITINKKETAIEGFDGKKGYAMNYANNKLEIYPNYVAESFDNDFIDYENKGFSAQFIGNEKVNGKDCFKVELTKNLNKTLYFFDAKSYMLLKEIKKDETLHYSEYKLVGKLMFPFRIESSSAKKDSDYVISLTKILTNKQFPQNTFKF